MEKRHCPCHDDIGTETQIVFENNHIECPPKRHHVDPVKVYNAEGKHVGYSWFYGDTADIVVDLGHILRKTRDFKEEELDEFLSDKILGFEFSDMRGEVDYYFEVNSERITTLHIGVGKAVLARNTYSLNLILKDQLLGGIHINLLRTPYSVFVK